MPLAATMLLFGVISLLTLIPAHACPSVCRCFADVPSVHCNRPTLDHIPQGIPNTTTTLQMKGTRLVSVRQGDLSGLPLLRTLYLYDNQVHTIQVGAFDNNPNIQSLAVSNNNISEVSPGVFRGLNSLRELDMRANKITSIPAGVFNGLPSLRVVRLLGNRVKTMSVGAFSNLSATILYSLESNRIERIANGVFGGPQGATTMMLNNNNISLIEPGALSSFVRMTRLWINGNRISTLQGVFTGLREMTQIYAQYNSISALTEEDFSGLTKLRELSLNKNKISTIAGRVFGDLSSLQTLYLADNEISDIGNDTFYGLFNLRYLYMSGNKLETVAGGNIWPNVSKSEWIYSSANKLTTVPREALANMSSLRSLVLSDNPIVYVGPDAFGPQLTEVKLQNTKLRIIDGAAFNSSPQVNRLTLSNNHLQYLPETVFQPLTYYGDHETLDLAGNPWVCDCQLAGYYAWLKTKGWAIPSLYCTSPPSLAGQSLRRLANNSLNCSCEAVESPRIDTAGSTTWAAAGDEAILRCKVNACPDAAVLWTAARGISLTSQSEFPNMYVQADGTLVIPAVTPGDAGRYTCMAVNAFGTAEAEIRLEVTVGPTGQAVGIHTFNHPVWIFAAVHVLVFYWYISGVDI
ncbi:PREDICTED: leucine-rich repeat and immunoglobulin-like domain-containing nogo receptor-interacting protein 1 [Branchiostoma belcheri]|uniref:Leucine-rich repeat and immunoglobulin-like domain-containing nogo receptor-interacting protein 1 n=1 Tax=Branchiostoma belcheri TaxID=7741 RepID=A0A6P4YL16_BRABE|nr:PREDICTED: leucine-rich repeat and immunoglobulin-like domain-containing nogo receptor-interacting protein 1 [Branchiostoma belcheri]